MSARNKEFREFLSEYVDLNASRVATLRERVATVNTFLGDLTTLGDAIAGDVIPQGSFALKTIIRPYKGNDFDADVLVPMSDNPDWEPRHYTEKLAKALEESSRYSGKIELRKRCVRIDYEGYFHIDLVPFVERGDSLTYITHRVDNEFIRQDPVAFTEWFREKHKYSNGNLIRVVRLLKYLRDRSSSDVPSVVLGALLAEQVQGYSGASGYGSMAATLTTLCKELSAYLDSHQSPPWVDDRVGQNLADRWTQTNFDLFKSQLRTWSKHADAALAAPESESVDLWRKLFGDDFARDTVEKSNQPINGSVPALFGDKSEVPGEKFLDRDFGIKINIDPEFKLRMVGRVAPSSKGIGRYRPLPGRGDLVPSGRNLKFSVDECNVPGDYVLYWKVRNSGEEARKRGMYRGEIKKGGNQITERSNFAGSHWVEVWAVKDGMAVATDRQYVTILSN